MAGQPAWIIELKNLAAEASRKPAIHPPMFGEMRRRRRCRASKPGQKTTA
jgi:hypothetical protein